MKNASKAADKAVYWFRFAILGTVFSLSFFAPNQFVTIAFANHALAVNVGATSFSPKPPILPSTPFRTTAAIFGAVDPILRDKDADRLFSQAGEAQNNGDFKFAVELWERFLEKHADDPQAIKARHYCGVCQMTLKSYSKAADCFAKVIADPKADQLPQLEESYYYLGWCQFSIGQQDESNNRSLEEAIATFNKHIAKFSSGKFLDQAYFLQGESYYFLGKTKESIAAYQKVVDDFKDSTSRSNAVYALGVSFFEEKQFDDAESNFDLFLKEFKEDELFDEVQLFKFESVLQRALEVAKTDQGAAKSLFESAKTGLSELANNEEFTKRDEALFNAALCESQLGNQKESAALYAKVADQFASSTYAKAAQLSAGKLFLRVKDFSNAEKWLKKSAATDEKNKDEANHWLCRCLLRQNKFEDAATLAKSAIQSATHPEFKIQLQLDQADALYEIPASKPKSIELFQAIAASHPEHAVAPQALYNAAFTALELKKFDIGLQLSKSYLEKYPTDSFLSDVKYVRAECFLLTQKNADAEPIYKDLIDNHPDAENVNAWRVRYALSLYLQDKYKSAISFLNDVKTEFKQPAEQAEASFIIGASHFYQNDFADSIPSLKSAIEFENDLKQLDEALVLIAQAYAKENQNAEAIASLEKLLNNFSDSRFTSQANYLCGQYLSSEKKYTEAITKFSNVLASEKNKYTAYALYGKGWAQLNVNAVEKAASDFSTIISDFTDHPLAADSYYSRAVANRRLKKYEQTISDIDECLKLKPEFSNLVSALYEKGMAESSSDQFDQAAETFDRLANDFSDNKDGDEFRYQLAWAFKSGKKEKQAIQNFKKLTEDFASSPLAPEAHFHVAESLYANAEFEAAVVEFEKAAASTDSEVGEKANYKMAWSHYQQKKYSAASKAFTNQVAKFENGDLADSAKFMIAECLFQQKKYKPAYLEFKNIKQLVVESTQTNEAEKALTCLHGAESANKSREYGDAISFIKTLQKDLKSKLYAAESMLELGNAYRGLKEYDNAVTAFQDATDLSTSETGARAGFLIGEVYFEQKKFEDAIRQYKLVIYGYGGSRAPDAIKKWQCSSGYETARCYQVQIKKETDAAKRKSNIEDALKFFNYVVDNHASDKLAIESKKQIESLKKLK